MTLRQLNNIRLAGAVALLALGFGTATPAAAQSRANPLATNTYANARFGYSLCYPPALLKPQGEADNGDGQKFLGADGAELLVWGENNALENTLTQAMEDAQASMAQDKGTVIYKASKDNWFVISGEIGDNIYYQKTIFSQDRFINFRLTYARATSAQYEPVVSQLAGCFRDGQPLR